MDNFFRSIERRAYRMAHIACLHREDALDLVQESMCRFVDKYSHKPKEEWKPLYYRILQNKIKDHRRKQIFRSRWQVLLPPRDEEGETDPVAEWAAADGTDPEEILRRKQAFAQLALVLQQLSLKQQQIFLLRAWEGLSTRETARAMNCTEGTVKTQYSRANARLKEQLGDKWP